MRITIRAKPRARKESIEKIDEENYIVSVKEPPVEGRANKAIIKALAGYFKIPSGNVFIVSGQTSRIKIIDVINPHT